MNEPDKLDTLLVRLIDRTQAGQLEWVKIADAPYQFHLESKSGLAVAIDSRDDDGELPYDLYIFDSEGGIVERLRWKTGANNPIDDERNDRLAALYRLARQSAHNVNRVIDTLLDEFDS